MVAVIVRSGAGKPTLLTIVDGLEEPDGREVIVGEAPLSRMSRNGRAAGADWRSSLELACKVRSYRRGRSPAAATVDFTFCQDAMSRNCSRCWRVMSRRLPIFT
jgi:ABC-type branched-subunit amino acid transport system ATPase component